MDTNRIVAARIHPAIGVARVGNSPTEWFLGPEVATPPPTEAGASRDATGALKRQAARFRIYGYDSDGNVVGEITMADADIAWNAHLANGKAAWYRFDAAMDVAYMKDQSVRRRNPDVVDRATLVIDAGAQTLTQPSSDSVRLEGDFRDTPVYLGELHTDANGRLIVLGGRGKSESPDGNPIFEPSDGGSFNNADGWYDDTSDGPIRATVTLDGQSIPVEPAWVIVGPPNYAPDVVGWRTMHDLQHDLAVANEWLPAPDPVRFAEHIQPILARLAGMQWVNYGFLPTFGRGSPFDFGDSEVMAKLAQAPEDGHDPYEELRRQVYNAIRPPSDEVAAQDPRPWPWIYSDTYGTVDFPTPNGNLATSEQRDALLRAWVDGDFVGGLAPASPVYDQLERYPIEQQPALLDQASMHFCLADAFHPGCELTWPMRHLSMYMRPLRIKVRDAGESEPDYGPELTQETALSEDGPLHAQLPGDLSRWMALPWQADTAWRRSAYDPEYDPYLPTYWPGRVPNWVLGEHEYDKVVDPNLSRDERIAAWHDRTNWFAALKGSTADAMMHVVRHFDQQLVVERRPGVPDDPEFPSVMLVGTGGAPKETRSSIAAGVKQAGLVPGIDPEQARRNARARHAGWDSAEQIEEVRRRRYRS